MANGVGGLPGRRDSRRDVPLRCHLGRPRRAAARHARRGGRRWKMRSTPIAGVPVKSFKVIEWSPNDVITVSMVTSSNGVVCIRIADEHVSGTWAGTGQKASVGIEFISATIAMELIVGARDTVEHEGVALASMSGQSRLGQAGSRPRGFGHYSAGAQPWNRSGSEHTWEPVEAPWPADASRPRQ